MSQPDYNLDDVLDAQLRAVPLPEGFMDRLRQAALTDEDLDAAVRQVPVPPTLDIRLRPPPLSWRRSLQNRLRMRRLSHWVVAISLLLVVSIGCLAVMVQFLIVASEARRASPSVAANLAGKPVDQRPMGSWLTEMDARFGPDSPDPLSGNRSDHWRGLLAAHRANIEPSEPTTVAEPPSREMGEPLVAKANDDSRSIPSPTLGPEPRNQMAPLAHGEPAREPKTRLWVEGKDAPQEKPAGELVSLDSGIDLFEIARLLRPQERVAQLERAKKCFQRFLAEHPSHPRAIGANVYLGNLLMEQAGIKTAEAFEPSQTPQQKAQLLDEARRLYRDAKQTFSAVAAALGEKRPSYANVDKNDAKQLEQRNQFERDAMLTDLALARIGYERAQTYEPGSKENRDELAAAAIELDECYRRNAPRFGAGYALVDEARCYGELGDRTRALKLLGEVLAQPEGSEGMRRVRASAAALALQIALPSDTTNIGKEP